MTLTLRSRLLLGVVIIGLVQLITAILVISITSDQILDQVDDRLVVAATAVDGSSDAAIDRISDVYQGVVSPDGELRTVSSLFERGDPVAPPELSVEMIVAADGAPFTTEAARSPDEYRVVAIEIGDDGWFVLAGLLDGYEWTINRLIRATAITATVVALVLAAVTWWVLRLGIRPVKQMTATAEAIAAGDLSGRIDDAEPGTEVGQLGVALNTMMGRIEHSFAERTRAEERLRQFIADASHELRTPVATIRGYAELHQAGGLREPADLDDAMRRTSEESQRMSRLIGDMLQLAKLDHDPTVRSAPVDLAAIARDTVTDARARHPERIFRTNLLDDAVVPGDDDLLRQAIANLVANAVVHTEPDATVTMSVASDGDTVTITVADDGPGMSPETVHHATERFYRADPSRSRRRGGSGLGLAIVASVVDAHGGDFAITSELGIGTTVAVALPSAPSDSQRTPS